LESWFIPREGSKKLIIANHPRFFSRYGFPSHLEPWKSMFAVGGNDFEISFIPDYKTLHDAGYNVLTYDLRNLGQSGSANGGMCTGGIFESRDVVGSILFARHEAQFRGMRIGLLSRCLGCSASIHAMARRPDAFEDIACMVGVQPVSPGVILGKMLELAHAAPELIEDAAQAVRLAIGFGLDEMSPVTPAKKVRIPTFLCQVRRDVLTHPSDVQSIFDNIPLCDKELHWIEGTTRRWDGYAYFAKEPERILAWFDRHMSRTRLRTHQRMCPKSGYAAHSMPSSSE
jgi:pimeloyl-ACP methyl ester carboxylesterase